MRRTRTDPRADPLGPAAADPGGDCGREKHSAKLAGPLVCHGVVPARETSYSF